ncbi:hypothetical protein MMC30_002033 [Trapelia coarctata]|nr:hypothetical protein [Trapelia coarctata]
MPRTRAQGLAQQQAGVAPSPPQSLPAQTRKAKRAPSAIQRATPDCENDHSFTPSPTLSDEKALVHIWLSPSRTTLAAMGTSVKPSIQVVVPRRDIVNFLKSYTSKNSDNPGSTKRRLEDSQQGSPPSKRPRMSPTANVLDVPAYDHHGNLVLAADADDTELSLLKETPSYTSANILTGFGDVDTQKGQSAASHNGTDETPHTQAQSDPATQVRDEVHAQPETPGRSWGLSSVLGSVRAASRLLPMFRRAPLNLADGNQKGTTGTSPLAHINTPNITAATATANGTTSTADSRAAVSENMEEIEKHSRKKSSKVSKKPSKSEQRKSAHKKKKKEKLNKEERLMAMLEANKIMIQNEVDRKVYFALKAEHEAAQAAQAPGTKRKRFSPTVIPNPAGCSYGMDLEFFGDDSDEEEEVSAAVEPQLEPQSEPEPEPSPSLRAAKRVRFTADTRFPLDPPLTQHADDTTAKAPEASNLTTTPLFSGSFSLPSSNMFAAGNVAVQSNTSVPSVIDNRTFTVPDESDSDDSLLEPANTYGEKGKDLEPTNPSEGDVIEAEPANTYGGNGKGVDWSTRNVGPSKPWQQDPPPAPTPSHAALPGSKVPSKLEESLARCRSEALRFTPKQPSTLRSVSRLSNSTIASSDSGDHEETTETPAGTNVATTEVFREETPAANRDLFRPAPTETPAANHDLFGPAPTQTPAANRDLFRSAPAETPAAKREAFREISPNQLNWVSEMDAELAKDAAERHQQYIPMDPVVANLNQIPLNDLIRFEFPSLGYTGPGMDPTVQALLDVIPDDQLIHFEFPRNQ